MSGDEDQEKVALVSSDANGASMKPLTSNPELKSGKLLQNSEVNDLNDIHTEIKGESEGRTLGDIIDHTKDSNQSSQGPPAKKSSCDLSKTNSDVNHEARTPAGNSGEPTQGSRSAVVPNMELDISSQQNVNATDPEDITGAVIETQPTGLSPLCPPQLEGLLDCMQVVIHKANLRHNIDISETAIAKYEIIDETRRVLFYVEKEPPPESEQSFRFRIYDKHKQPAIEVYNPLSSTCFMCHSSWHCLKKFKFQAVVLSPPGLVAGFVKRSNTCLLQEFDILSPQEDLLLVMRGGPYDLEIYSTDLDTGLGRMAVRGWHGIMHEVKRSGDDIGLTFPLDLDVRVKAVLLGAVFSIDWLYSTRNGTRP